MFGTGTKLSRKVMILALFIAGSLWFAKDSTRAFLIGAQDKKADASPTIVITQQERAPLQIISTWIKSKKAQNFRLVAQVQNQGTKAIRAYAINSLMAASDQQNGRSDFTNLTKASALWQPTAIRTVEIRDSQEGKITSVRLIVDFVEFDDGTTWGADTENSRDILAGQREGAKSERRRLRQLMQTKGREGLINELKTDDASKVESLKDSHSSQWLSGFRSGVSSVRRRLDAAIASGDKGKIDAELFEHFDTSEKVEQK